MADEDLCIACTLIVTTRQEALQCDGCDCSFVSDLHLR